MFLELEDKETKKRLLLNLETVFAVIETQDGAAALSIGGAKMDIPMEFETLRDAIALYGEEEDGD